MHKIKKIYRTLRLLSLGVIFTSGYYSANAMAGEVSFSGSEKKVITIKGDKSTGLDDIFVAYNTSDLTKLEISGISGTIIDVSQYSNLGGGYADPVPYNFEGGIISISSPRGDMGYIVSTDKGNYCFWLVDYSSKPLRLTGVRMEDSQDCETTKIEIEGTGGAIHYYTIDGRPMTLSREITVRYNTLSWDDNENIYLQSEENKVLSSLSGSISLTPPFYCTTSVEISGDRFLKEWGMTQHIESEMFPATSVAVESRAEQSNLSTEEASNVIRSESDGLGGSAPADITFYGYVTDAVLHTEWQMASDPEFQYIIYRFNEQDVSYTFLEEGRYYMRFIGSNSDGSCESIGETYTISIGASDLRIPNAFSPNNDGINDVWKVGYRSLIEFSCWIFDSKGTQMFHFEDPSQGWDGKYKGKPVKPGVYYYVIQAKGADGVKYKKSGDINILNFKKYGNSTGSAEE